MRKVRLYDESAAAYHRRYQQIQQIKYRAIANYLQAGPVVDVGIGTGIGLPILIDFAPVIGIDGAIEMLRIAQAQAQNPSNRQEPIHLVCGSAETLPLRTSAFPIAVSITVLQNLANIDAGINELLRITQINGLVAVTALAKVLSLRDLKTRFNSSVINLAELESLSNEDVGLILRVIQKKNSSITHSL
ncbi:MAG: class I SAM-dependent methyltransferase [Candidatus Hodarchaeota archaeon]